MTSPPPITLAAALLAGALISVSHAAEKKNRPSSGKPAATKTEDSPAKLGLADDGKTGRLPGLTAGLSDLAAQAFARKDWEKARGFYLEMLKT